MLLRDIPPAQNKIRVLEGRKKVALEQKSLPKVPREKLTRKNQVHINTSSSKAKAPLWLQSLNVLNHGSALFSYLTVAAALVMYGMTVYAPKLWTQKYTQLQDLQKRERQFISAEEMFKDELAQSANQSDSGFVKPNVNNSPIFLPNQSANAIKLKSSTSLPTKIIKPVSPIAY